MAVSKDPATKAYIARFVPTMVTYAALVTLMPLLIARTHAQGSLLWVLALVPAAPIISVFALIGRYWVELRDEYVRMLEIRKALIATALTMAFATAWGFLEIYAHVPHLPTVYVPVIWFGGLAVGALVNVIVERRAGDGA